MNAKFLHSLVLIFICFCGSAANSQDVASVSDETAKLEAAIQSYVAAFNAKDVDKLAAHWSPDGVYTSRSTGEQSVGRAAIVESFTQTFGNANVPKLAVTTESIEFVSPNVALERGKATVTHSADEIIETDYSVVYVKRDGGWLIDRVTEEEIVIETTHYDELQSLEWLIGDWTTEGDGFRVDFTCSWTTKQNFISRKFTVYDELDQVVSSGLQVIGWDAKAKAVRSWLFDSEGGVITGSWNKRDDGWAVQSVAMLVDGSSGSFTSFFRIQEDGNLGWEKINRVVDGKLLPNIDEIVYQRK